MLCLCGFELYSRWVPLIQVQNEKEELDARVCHDGTRHTLVPSVFVPLDRRSSSQHAK